jgi:uncharacterized membrane protein
MNKPKEQKETVLGISENLEGLLAYSLGIITGVVFLFLEKKNKFVRFHAAQSVAFSLVILVLSAIPFLGWLFSFILVPVGFGLWLFLMYKAYKGEKYKLPYLGDFVEREIESK